MVFTVLVSEEKIDGHIHVLNPRAETNNSLGAHYFHKRVIFKKMKYM